MDRNELKRMLMPVFHNAGYRDGGRFAGIFVDGIIDLVKEELLREAEDAHARDEAAAEHALNACFDPYGGG